MPPSKKRCVDCVAEDITTYRKLKVGRNGKPVPGPRCATHHRAKRNTRRTYSHEKHIWDTYGITKSEYWAIYAAQGGKCALCRRATGATKNLSVDHDHVSGRVRGLLCQKCNRDVLGHLRDDPEAFLRGIDYLTNPPALAVIGSRVVPNHEGT